MRDAILLLGPTGSGKSPLGDAMQKFGLKTTTTTSTTTCTNKATTKTTTTTSVHPVVHFDFGENLRRAERGDFPVDLISLEDRSYLTTVLEEGVLLEQEKFYLAGNILSAFLLKNDATANNKEDEEDDKDNNKQAQSSDDNQQATTSSTTPRSIVALNGFPRHTLQAEYIAQFVQVKLLVLLEVPDPETVYYRLHHNTGGDRTDRPAEDASLELLQKKLHIYQERTLPLVNFYSNQKKNIMDNNVNVVPVVKLVSGKNTTAEEMLHELNKEIDMLLLDGGSLQFRTL